MAKDTPILFHVIVCYNDLARCSDLIATLREDDDTLTRNLFILVDNSDAPSDAHKEKRVLSSLKAMTDVVYYKPKTNVGSAGGFRYGMRFAHRYGKIYARIDISVWLHDSDGKPMIGCKTILMNKLQNLQCDIVAPKIIDEQGHDNIAFHRTIICGPILRKVKANFEKDLDCVGSAGVLMSWMTLERFGYYLSEPYFFTNLEDYEYSIRIKSGGGKIVLIPDAEYFHPSMTSRLPFSVSISAIQLNLTNLKNTRAYFTMSGAAYIYKKYFNSFWFYFVVFITYISLRLASKNDVSTNELKTVVKNYRELKL